MALGAVQKLWFFSAVLLNAIVGICLYLVLDFRTWPMKQWRFILAASLNGFTGLALTILAFAVTRQFGWAFLFGTAMTGPHESSDDPAKARALSFRRLIARSHWLTSTISAFMMLPVIWALGHHYHGPININLQGPLLEDLGRPQRTAIIGGGAAGVTAAFMLKHRPDLMKVKLFEAEDKLGGHAHAASFNYTSMKDGKIKHRDLDMGFLFGNPSAYKVFKMLLSVYGVERRPSKISVSSSVKGKVIYTTDDIEKHPFGWEEADRFHRLVEEPITLEMGLMPWKKWLAKHGFSEEFKQEVLTPVLSTLFITKTGLFEQSTSFMMHMFRHRSGWVDLLHAFPVWTVEGSSKALYAAMQEDFIKSGVELALDTPVQKVTRLQKGDSRGRVALTLPDGSEEYFDSVIFATAANVARQLVRAGGSSAYEDFVLSQTNFEPEIGIFLHSDLSVMPANRADWRAFNFKTDKSYKEMQKLLGVPMLTGLMPEIFDFDLDEIPADQIPLLTINPMQPIDQTKVVDAKYWSHHTQDVWHIFFQTVFMPTIQYIDSIAYAGDWTCFIGHAEAMKSGIQAACRVGAANMPHFKDRGQRMGGGTDAEGCWTCELNDEVPRCQDPVQKMTRATPRCMREPEPSAEQASKVYKAGWDADIKSPDKMRFCSQADVRETILQRLCLEADEYGSLSDKDMKEIVTVVHMLPLHAFFALLVLAILGTPYWFTFVQSANTPGKHEKTF